MFVLIDLNPDFYVYIFIFSSSIWILTLSSCDLTASHCSSAACEKILKKTQNE